MKVQLEAFHQKAKAKRISIARDIVIGRGAECDLRIASSEVSREHCKLVVGENEVFIHDLGSSNGTILDGKKITANENVPVASNSMLVVGPMKLVVRFDSPETEVAEPSDKAPAASIDSDTTTDVDAPTVSAEPAAGETDNAVETAGDEIISEESEAEFGGFEDDAEATAETVQIAPRTIDLGTDGTTEAEEAFPSFDEPPSDPEDATSIDVQTDEPDEVELEAADETEVPDASEADVAEETPKKKGKLHGLFGMLGRKKKAQTAEPEEVAVESTTELIEESETVEDEAVEDEAVEVEPADEDELSAEAAEDAQSDAESLQEPEEEYAEVEPEFDGVSEDDVMGFLGDEAVAEEQPAEDDGLSNFLNQFEKE